MNVLNNNMNFQKALCPSVVINDTKKKQQKQFLTYSFKETNLEQPILTVQLVRTSS